MNEQLIEARDLSYANVVTIPAGSMNVQVFETGKSRNLIAATISLPEVTREVLEWQIPHLNLNTKNLSTNLLVYEVLDNCF